MKTWKVVLLCVVCFFVGWWANRDHCNVKAYWMGYEAGQHDGMSTALTAAEGGG